MLRFFAVFLAVLSFTHQLQDLQLYVNGKRIDNPAIKEKVLKRLAQRGIYPKFSNVVGQKGSGVSPGGQVMVVRLPPLGVPTQAMSFSPANLGSPSALSRLQVMPQAFPQAFPQGSFLPRGYPLPVRAVLTSSPSLGTVQPVNQKPCGSPFDRILGLPSVPCSDSTTAASSQQQIRGSFPSSTQQSSSITVVKKQFGTDIQGPQVSVIRRVTQMFQPIEALAQASRLAALTQFRRLLEAVQMRRQAALSQNAPKVAAVTPPMKAAAPPAPTAKKQEVEPDYDSDFDGSDEDSGFVRKPQWTEDDYNTDIVPHLQSLSSDQYDCAGRQGCQACTRDMKCFYCQQTGECMLSTGFSDIIRGKRCPTTEIYYFKTCKVKSYAVIFFVSIAAFSIITVLVSVGFLMAWRRYRRARVYQFIREKEEHQEDYDDHDPGLGEPVLE